MVLSARVKSPTSQSERTGRSSIGANERPEPGQALVWVLSDVKRKQGAKVRGRAESCTIRQGVSKCRGRKIEGAECAYLLVGIKPLI